MNFYILFKAFKFNYVKKKIIQNLLLMK